MQWVFCEIALALSFTHSSPLFSLCPCVYLRGCQKRKQLRIAGAIEGWLCNPRVHFAQQKAYFATRRGVAYSWADGGGQKKHALLSLRINENDWAERRGWFRADNAPLQFSVDVENHSRTHCWRWWSADDIVSQHNKTTHSKIRMQIPANWNPVLLTEFEIQIRSVCG